MQNQQTNPAAHREKVQKHDEDSRSLVIFNVPEEKWNVITGKNLKDKLGFMQGKLVDSINSFGVWTQEKNSGLLQTYQNLYLCKTAKPEGLDEKIKTKDYSEVAS